MYFSYMLLFMQYALGRFLSKAGGGKVGVGGRLEKKKTKWPTSFFLLNRRPNWLSADLKVKKTEWYDEYTELVVNGQTDRERPNGLRIDCIVDRIDDITERQRLDGQRIDRIDGPRTKKEKRSNGWGIDRIDYQRAEKDIPNGQQIDCVHRRPNWWSTDREKERPKDGQWVDRIDGQQIYRIDGQRKEKDRMVNELTAYIADRIGAQRTEKGRPNYSERVDQIDGQRIYRIDDKQIYRIGGQRTEKDRMVNELTAYGLIRRKV